MGDEFQAGICGGNWWNSSRSGLSVGSCSSPCSTALTDMGSFGWASEARSSCEDTTASVSDSSMVFPHTQKLPQAPDSVDVDGGGGGGGGGAGGVMMDSTLQMMGFGPSSLTMDWNQTLLSRGSGRGSETDFHSMLQDELSSRPIFRRERGMESPTHQVVQKEWIPKSSSFSGGGEDSSSLNAYNKQINQIFPLDQQQQQQQQHQPSFACNSSSLLPGLFDPPETQLQQHQQSHFDQTHRSINIPSPNYRINSSEFTSPSPSLPSQSPSWPKFPAFLKQHQPSGQLHFSNNAPYWNASAAPMNDARSTFFSSPQTQFLSSTFEEKPTCSSLTTAKSGTEDVRDSGSVVKKGSSETGYKRPRIETPSPLPTFKVRKEKLGDRITALQQLVSPFGKTDTASVLFEAIEYIKFLHDQISALSTPYMKNGAPTQHQQSSDKSKDGEGPKQDLKSRGLCLVPISSTFPVTTETAADFWTPFGGTYR